MTQARDAAWNAANREHWHDHYDEKDMKSVKKLLVATCKTALDTNIAQSLLIKSLILLLTKPKWVLAR